MTEAVTKESQWYSSDTSLLKKLYQDFKGVAMQGQVGLSRDSVSHDISMSFIDMRYKRKWEVEFPAKFPVAEALLIENPDTSENKKHGIDMTEVVVKNMIEAVKNMIFCISERKKCDESDEENAGGSCAVTEHSKLVSGMLLASLLRAK